MKRPAILLLVLAVGGWMTPACARGAPAGGVDEPLVSTSAPPFPVFTRFFLQPTIPAITYTQGQMFYVLMDIYNAGGDSDDGRVIAWFPSACSATPMQYPPGSARPDSACGTIITSVPSGEFQLAPWRAGQTQTMQLLITPQAIGSFTFDVRCTMHVPGTACGYVNGLPPGGADGHVDERGWAVKRFVVTVRPNTPYPVFTELVQGVPDSLTFGSSFTLTTSLQNAGTTTDDGRLVVSFPQLTDVADGAWVTNSTGGDVPGFRTFAAGSLVPNATCGASPVPCLAAEYADQSWGGYDAFGVEVSESNAVAMTVTPQAIGDFFIDVRGIMRSSSLPCWLNAVPPNGEGQTDALGWPVKRFRVRVTPPSVSDPVPVIFAPVEISTTSIALGDSFTVRVRARDDGVTSDRGVLHVAFPSLTDPSDAARVAMAHAGDDLPGYRELPIGSSILDASCRTMVAPYLVTEYEDDDWQGILSGQEQNELNLTVCPRAVGTFYFDVRCTMHKAGTVCEDRNALPPNGASGDTDPQGWPVRRFAVTVTAPLTAPEPRFYAGPVGLPPFLTLGQSFTMTLSCRNDGLASDLGRISVSFPSFTHASDAQWVSSSSTGDRPGYRELPAGTSIPSVDCRTSAAEYLAVEYADSNWVGGGVEANQLALTITPQAAGVFVLDVRCTMHRIGSNACDDVNALPDGGTGPFADQQGWAVRRFEVPVYLVPPPGSPTVRWDPVTPVAAGPSPRASFAATYDAGRDALVIYGGADPSYHGDVWRLPLTPGSAWSQILPGGPTPLRRTMASMIHNPIEDQLVIFGGLYDDGLNDLAVVALQPVVWWFLYPGQATSPTPRYGQAAVYDSRRHRMLVIGGYDGSLQNDVWEYPLPGNGTWTRLQVAGTPMPGRLQHAAVYDAAGDRVLIFGGDGGVFLGDAWDLRLGGTPTWAPLNPTGLPPPGRREHTMVLDPVRNRLIVFGGFNGSRLNDLWALRLGDPPIWERLYSSTAAPAPRGQHAAIYDPTRDQMVMFGGQLGTTALSNEVWRLSFDIPTATRASLAEADASSERVRLVWQVESAASIVARVLRSFPGSSEWTDLGAPSAAGDRLVFEDHEITPGATLGYRLVESPAQRVLDEQWVTIPQYVGLALMGASPNPAGGALWVSFSLPAGGPAALELFDLSGRRLARREVGGFGPGTHRLALSDVRPLPAGAYLIRLTRAGRVLTSKACVVR